MFIVTTSCNVIRQKGIDLNHNFHVFVGKQCRTENAYMGHQYIILKLKTSLELLNNKSTLVNLDKDIVLMTRVHCTHFYTELFTNNNIKVVIQINAFLTDLQNL